MPAVSTNAIYAFRTSTYARDIYLYGNRTFSQIDQQYVPFVKEYAAKTYTTEQIENALAKGWITQSQYDETITLKNAII